MLGKTFKGLTDAMLAWQTERLLALEAGRDEHTVYVRPELVVEIAFNDIQESPRYPGRLALRFARVKRYRTDTTPAEADTFDTIRAIFRQTTGLEPPAGNASGGECCRTRQEQATTVASLAARRYSAGRWALGSEA
jgi:DNA ligase-1